MDGSEKVKLISIPQGRLLPGNLPVKNCLMCRLGYCHQLIIVYIEIRSLILFYD